MNEGHVGHPTGRNPGTMIVETDHMATVKQEIAEAKAQEYVTTVQLARLLNISVKTVRRAVRDGRLPALRMARQLRIHRVTALRAFANGWTGEDTSAREHPQPRA